MSPPQSDLQAVARCRLVTLTRPAPHGLLCDALLRCAPEQAHVAMATPTTEFTYAQLLERARGVAELLVQSGGHVGDRVAVMLPKSAWMLVAAYGAAEKPITLLRGSCTVNESGRVRMLEFFVRRSHR